MGTLEEKRRTRLNILDVVALTEDLPDRGLYRGQAGTVVESLAPGVFEVEFSDDEGRAYASLSLEASQLLVSQYEPVEAFGYTYLWLRAFYCRMIVEVKVYRNGTNTFEFVSEG